jgi:hypothetical protein
MNRIPTATLFTSLTKFASLRAAPLYILRTTA